jgi:hypothetical protein
MMNFGLGSEVHGTHAQRQHKTDDCREHPDPWQGGRHKPSTTWPGAWGDYARDGYTVLPRLVLPHAQLPVVYRCSFVPGDSSVHGHRLTTGLYYHH